MQTPPNLRRSPVLGLCEPLPWNSCCMLPCQPHTMCSHQKAEKTYKRRLPTTYRSKNLTNQRRNASSFLQPTEAGRPHLCLFPQAGTYRKEGGDVDDQQRQHFLHHATSQRDGYTVGERAPAP